MKNISKICLLGAILLLAVTLLFTACGGGNQPAGTSGPQGSGTGENPEPPAPAEPKLLADAGEVLYTVISCEDATDDVKESVTALRNALANRSGGGVALVGYADLKDYKADTLEILIGDTGYPESNAVLENLNLGDWTVTFRDNKLIVASYSRDGLNSAITELIKQIKNGATEDGTISLPGDLAVKQTAVAMINNLPAYQTQAQAKPMTADEGQNAAIAVYTGTNLAEYSAYLEKLSTLGYTAYTGNTIGENKFATYQNDTYLIHAGYYAYENAARVTIEKKTALIPLENENNWQKASGVVTSLAQVGLGTAANENAYNGMAYCYQLADGSFIVIDGGFYNDAERLYNYMKAKAPGGNVVIAAWFITHNDGDHTQCFSSFATTYRYQVKVEMVVKNFPSSATYMESNGNDNLSAQIGADTLPDCRVIKAHTGQKFYIRNAVVEMLYTLDSYYPAMLKIFNNSSLVFTVDVEGERTLFAGDASDEVCGILTSMYGDYLRCDILQLPHHGLRNGHGLSMAKTNAFMKVVRPEIVLWPSTDGHYLNEDNEAEQQQVALFTWNNEAMKSAREVYLAGGDRITVLELPYRIFSAYIFDANVQREPVANETPSGEGNLTFNESVKDNNIPHVKWGDGTNG